MPRHEEGFFSAKDNLRLFWESDVPERPKAYVGVVHGYADHCGRFRQVLDALVEAEFAAFAFDYRGHGQSGGRRGHVDHFEQYLDDLELFWERTLAAANGKKAFLLAHSHGALIAIRLLQERRPKGMAGAIFSAPFLKLAFPPPRLKIFAARALGKVVPWLPVNNELKPEQLTRDPERQRVVAKDHLYNHVATPRWYDEAMAAQQVALARAGEITLPSLVFWGAEDPIALPAASKEFCERLGSSDKRCREYAGMRHETLNEVGREEVWKDVVLWISGHL